MFERRLVGKYQREYLMKILFLSADSNGNYPIPAVKGGAVSTLVEYFLENNQNLDLASLNVISYYDEKASERAKKYTNTNFIWIRIPKILNIFDKFLFNIIKIFFKNEKAVSFKTIFSLLYYISKSKKFIKKNEFDYIIIENNIPLSLIFKNSLPSAKIIYHLHNVPRVNVNNLNFFKNVHYYLCVSDFVANKLNSDQCIIGKINKNKIKLLYNTIDCDKFKPLYSKNIIKAKRKEYGLNEDDFVIIFVGRLTEEKGALELLKAMQKLPKNVKTLIVGSYHYNSDVKTKYQEKLRNEASKLGDRIVFTGYIQHDLLPLYYNIADIAVLPSIWDEPAGLTNLEAMACGTPIITTNAGGISEYVGQSVVLNRNDDLIDSIAKEINKFMSDSNYLHYMKDYSVNYVKTNFNKDNYLNNLLKILNSER